jgi:energy-coupling factor transporter ATP-binding protein EcfA2
MTEEETQEFRQLVKECPDTSPIGASIETLLEHSQKNESLSQIVQDNSGSAVGYQTYIEEGGTAIIGGNHFHRMSDERLASNQSAHQTQESFESEEDFFLSLRKRCCDQNQDCNFSTQLFTKESLDLPQIYVLPLLIERPHIKRVGKDENPEKNLVNKVLKEHNHIVIIGSPGMGKSTILEHIFLEECKQSENNLKLFSFSLDPYEDNERRIKSIPILIRLREKDGNKDFNFKEEIKRILEISDTQMVSVFRSGRLLLLVDGLDEVAEAFRAKACSQLMDLANSYRKNKVILTCRSTIVFQASQSFKFFEVANLDQKQQNRFTRNYFSLAMKEPDSWIGRLLHNNSDINDQKLNRKIQVSNRLSELAQSPLLLSMICIVYMDSGDLPEKRSELYSRGIEIYLKQWDDYRVSQPRSQSESYRKLKLYGKKELLEELAYFMFSRESEYTQISEDELVSFISENKKVTLDEGYEILLGIAADHGLLIEPIAKQWEFSHLTFQEYFTAKWVLRCQKWDMLAAKIMNEKWREVIQLVVESKPMTLSWFEKSKSHIDNFIVHDSTLQSLLEVISNKASQLSRNNTLYPYKQASTRAFYYDLGLSFSSINQRTSHIYQCLYFDLSHAIDEKMSDALEAQYEGDIALDVFHDAVNLEHGMQQYDDHPETVNKIAALYAESERLFKDYADTERELYKDLLYDSNILEEIFNLVHHFRPFYSPGIFARNKFACTPCVDVSNFFKSHVALLLDKQLFVEPDVTLIKSLLSLLRKERNIGHIYTLEDEQRQQADRYYKANVFLMKLLQTPNAATSETRAAIEDAVLLPNAALQCKSSEIYK